MYVVPLGDLPGPPSPKATMEPGNAVEPRPSTSSSCPSARLPVQHLSVAPSGGSDTVAPCQITVSATGPFLTLHALVAGCGAGVSAAGAGAVTLSSPSDDASVKKRASPIQTLHLDTREHVTAMKDSTAGGSMALGPPSCCYRDVPAMWALLKERLSLWCLSRCFQEAGLMPPFGLHMLPGDVKDQIFAKLKVGIMEDSPEFCVWRDQFGFS